MSTCHHSVVVLTSVRAPRPRLAGFFNYCRLANTSNATLALGYEQYPANDAAGKVNGGAKAECFVGENRCVPCSCVLFCCAACETPLSADAPSPLTTAIGLHQREPFTHQREPCTHDHTAHTGSSPTWLSPSSAWTASHLSA
jgi:hypothetical protein